MIQIHYITIPRPCQVAFYLFTRCIQGVRRAGANGNAEKRANFFSVIGKCADTAEFFHSFCTKPVEKCKPLWKTLWKLCKTRKNRGSRVLRPVVENPPERNAGNSDTVFQHFPIFPHTEAKIALSPPRGARGRRKGRPGAQSIKYVPKPEVRKTAFRRIFALQTGTAKRAPPPKGDRRSPEKGACGHPRLTKTNICRGGVSPPVYQESLFCIPAAHFRACPV